MVCASCELVVINFSCQQFDQRCLLSRLVCLNSHKEGLIHSVINERKKMDAFQLFLRKLRFTDNAYQKKPILSCLSAQQMSKHVRTPSIICAFTSMMHVIN